MDNISLIVAFYNGLRDSNQEQFYKEYINLHKLSFKNLKHNLKQIFFVISEDNRDSISYETIDNIIYIYRPNKNLSFGAWVDVMLLFNIYDYYILCEDDYIFTKDNFDTILYNSYINNNCNYLVTWRDKNYNDLNFQGELISTIGILSKNEISLFNDFNSLNTKNKGEIMLNFLKKFNKISQLDENNNLFPYWCYELQSVYFHGLNNNIINYECILLACYQFVIEHKSLFFNI